MTTITIHRGTHQIGGCVTEIKTDKTRVFIDFGSNLSEGDAPNMQLDGLTTGDCGSSALFLTHYHGDHIGRLAEVKSGVPIYMGETATAIQMNYIERVKKDSLPLFEKIETFEAGKPMTHGDITVTPLMIDHSAFDAFMFVIEAGGCRILYTGDFRLHGIRGSKTLTMLSKRAKDIDYIICEGTTLSRTGEPPWSEHELKRRASIMMKDCKYVFVLCASTNIDRIGIFYNANPKGRLFVCDSYQKKQLMSVMEKHAEKSSFYDFKNVKSYGKNLDKAMEEKGFCMLIKQGKFQDLLEKYKDKSLVIYSMWTGYLDERAKNQGLCDYLAPYRYCVLHTSGHATPEDIRLLFETINPKRGLIPIHTDAPDMFNKFVPEGKLKQLEDGVPVQL